MIEVKNIKRFYRMGEETVKAVNDVSFTIGEGQFIALLGPSGSGKSTIMHLLGGLEDPDEGEILIDGENIAKYSDEEQATFRNKKIGFIFQSFNLQPSLTALENVELPLKFAGIKTKERIKLATEALKQVGLGKRIKHKPSELSGGERQRVSIARAIVNNPRILLADEPTGNLDSKTGEEIMKLIKDLNEEKKNTVILVTHAKEHALYAKETIYIKDGKIVERL